MAARSSNIVNGRWTAGDLQHARSLGLPLAYLSETTGLSIIGVKRMLKRPAGFIFDVPASRHNLELFLHLTSRYQPELTIPDTYYKHDLEPIELAWYREHDIDMDSLIR
jgi:hypothetical protein